MSDFASIIADVPEFSDYDRNWLHHLVADWQVIADLSYADLLLAVPYGDEFIIAGQCRPSTNISVRQTDMIGTLCDAAMYHDILRARQGRNVVYSREKWIIDGHEIADSFVPIWFQQRLLGVVIMETSVQAYAVTGRFELESIEAAKRLFSMIAYGEFPYSQSVISQSHTARVADGFMILSDEGIIDYASPNAVSCFKRLGYMGDLFDTFLSEVATSLLHEHDTISELMPLVFSGKGAVDYEFEANGAVATVRSFPLNGMYGHDGAIILCRDITELRRRERELKTKDATISEIHHRVKNNLQAVSALLRLQARRTHSEEVKLELEEAIRRVDTIAIVHEGLSQTADEVVDFDAVIANLLRMSIDLATHDEQRIAIDFEGKFGLLSAQDATPLSLVLTELVTNAVEHGFEERTTGTITIVVQRNDNTLYVNVEDDGNGLPLDEHGVVVKPSGTGLGTQIINTFVTSDFAGSVNWENRDEGGMRVRLIMHLHEGITTAGTAHHI